MSLIKIIMWPFVYLEKPVEPHLPDTINDAWLDSLKLIDIPKDSLHYSDRELAATIKQLEHRLNRDDPTEEYKVGAFKCFCSRGQVAVNLFSPS